ncbi:hypothetical protein IQE94_03025 [Synechocystis sp. PCC 7339]|uniref:hypothetical protein n=1 Tax=unclassified Synechocystis TaxID=2640012 RepID=UPI001BAE84FE|nr:MULTISPECIES: hypothetical protein [unclassified Synechocystis]QUS61135.1 hypothetical protein HTZ78_10960 [Synechocystis sp. PCC 7338]UAJ73317.1 hypothetical protein IQE94_03025 [Synechocystis sp. PCC 7339]
MSSPKSKAITVRPTPPLSPRLAAEEKFKQEKLHDTELLLQDMFIREEATVKLIFDSLYDIGVINIINKKFPFPPLNRLLKSIVGVPKPIAKILLFRWFVANCPGLLTNWLHSKVRFK